MRSLIVQRRLINIVVGIVWATPFLLALSSAACATRTPPNLDPAAQAEFTLLQVVKVTNDATTAAIAANRTGVLKDDAERQVLTINKQVLDYIQANPQGTKGKALEIIRQARQALSPDVDAAIAVYLQKVIDALLEVG